MTMLLHSSSPFSLTCSTPSRSSYYSARSHQPLSSSPLASPTYSSPTHDAQRRRRAQYKSTTPSSHRPTASSGSAKLLFRAGAQASEDPQKAFLRERLQARCREHAQKLRQRTVDARRSSDKCSDVFMDCDDEDEDEDESDDAVMQDELFRRIVQNANHRKNYSYRVSYALEVGSSFDPDLEDPSAWESELHGESTFEAVGVFARSLALLDSSSGAEPTPDDFDQEFLEYAEKCAALADFADLDLADETDFEDLMSDVRRHRESRPTSDMDMS